MRVFFSRMPGVWIGCDAHRFGTRALELVLSDQSIRIFVLLCWLIWWCRVSCRRQPDGSRRTKIRLGSNRHVSKMGIIQVIIMTTASQRSILSLFWHLNWPQELTWSEKALGSFEMRIQSGPLTTIRWLKGTKIGVIAEEQQIVYSSIPS